jgi:hypothetical protein
MDNMNEYIVYKFIEPLIYTSYLFFVFLSIQILFLWNDIDKKIVNSIITRSFLRKNCLYLLSLSVFFILFDLTDDIKQFNANFAIFEILAPVTLLLASYEWYSKLRPRVNKLLPEELTNFKHFPPVH